MVDVAVLYNVREPGNTRRDVWLTVSLKTGFDASESAHQELLVEKVRTATPGRRDWRKDDVHLRVIFTARPACPRTRDRILNLITQGVDRIAIALDMQVDDS